MDYGPVLKIARLPEKATAIMKLRIVILHPVICLTELFQQTLLRIYICSGIQYIMAATPAVEVG